MNIGSLFGLGDDGTTVPTSPLAPQTPRGRLRAAHRRLKAAEAEYAQAQERMGREGALQQRMKGLQAELDDVLSSKYVPSLRDDGQLVSRQARSEELDTEIAKVHSEQSAAIDENLNFAHDNLLAQQNYCDARRAHQDAASAVVRDDVETLAGIKHDLQQRLVEVDAVLQGVGEGTSAIEGGSELRKRCEMVRRALPPQRGDVAACLKLSYQQRDEKELHFRTVERFRGYVGRLLADPDARLELDP